MLGSVYLYAEASTSGGANVSVNELRPVDDQDHEARAASTGGWSAWLPRIVVRYRAMTLVPLLVLAGVTVAGLADLPALVNDAAYGSGCCPPR